MTYDPTEPVDTNQTRTMLDARGGDTINVVGILLCDILDELRAIRDRMSADAACGFRSRAEPHRTGWPPVDSAGRGPGKI